jgi:hypothetical protein
MRTIGISVEVAGPDETLEDVLARIAQRRRGELEYTSEVGLLMLDDLTESSTRH